MVQLSYIDCIIMVILTMGILNGTHNRAQG